MQTSVALYPPAWRRLEQLAGELVEHHDQRTASAAGLLVAIVHFYLPAELPEAIGLVQDYRLRVAGVAGEPLYPGERPARGSVRLFASQRDRLTRLGEEVGTALDERAGRSLLLGALLNEHTPADAEQAATLLRAFQQARIGASEAAVELLGAGA